MNIRLFAGILFMFGAYGHAAAADTSTDDTQPAGKTSTAAGVILEYNTDTDRQVREEEVDGRDAPPASNGRSVEFIVGGQAEDGVAKHKKINVRK